MLLPASAPGLGTPTDFIALATATIAVSIAIGLDGVGAPEDDDSAAACPGCSVCGDPCARPLLPPLLLLLLWLLLPLSWAGGDAEAFRAEPPGSQLRRWLSLAHAALASGAMLCSWHMHVRV